MTRYVLDTTFLIDHLRGDVAARDRLRVMYEEGDDPIVTSVTSAEAWAGQRGPEVEAIDEFLRFFEYVHAGPETARLAGTWRAVARTNGRSLDITDALIAATAVDLQATVLTRNLRDFALTPVRIETY